MSMVATPSEGQWSSFFKALGVQMRVIGAVLMRELHTRYGRDNIGYLWMVAEPLMFGSVISLIRSGEQVHDKEFSPVGFAVVGYAIFIMFRSIVGRSDGALSGNLPLLYHRMVTVLDIVIARAILEAAGTFVSFIILLTFFISVDFMDFPARPLMLLVGIGYVLWLSLGLSMIIVGGTYEKRTLERLIHPMLYFMIPLSGAFYRVGWVPQPYRRYLLWNPLPQAFEIVRYGQFEGGTLEYVNFIYLTGACMIFTLLGLVALRSVRGRIHLT